LSYKENKINDFLLFSKICNSRFRLLTILIVKLWLLLPLIFIFVFLFNRQHSVCTHIVIAICGYFHNNIFFMMSHISLHTSFIEVPEKEMRVVTYAAYLHHYYNPSLLYPMDFYEYQFAYLHYIDYKKTNNVSLKLLFNVILSLIIYFLYPNVYLQILLWLLLSLYFGAVHLSLCTIMFANLYINKDLHFAVLVMLYHILFQYFQALVHMWYHVPLSKDKKHLGIILYNICSFLEYICIFDKITHRIHHKHDINSLHETEIWSDMKVPQFVENIASNIWDHVNKKYVKGHRYMTDYMGKFIIARIIIYFT
jgi:hypothetical protein